MPQKNKYILGKYKTECDKWGKICNKFIIY